MPTVAGREAVYLTILQKLSDAIGANAPGMEVWTANGRESVYYQSALPNVARIFADFYMANNRMPNTLFNDGVYPGFRPGDLIRFAYEHVFYGDTGETQGQFETTNAYPTFSVPVYLSRPYDVSYVRNTNEQGTQDIATVGVQGLIPSRFAPIDGVLWVENVVPISAVEFGAFKTWGVLMVAATHPQFVYATDDGLLLTPQGVAMIEKSIAHWIADYSFKKTGFVPISYQAGIFGNGPVMVGIPFSIIDRYFKVHTQGNFGDVFKFIAKLVIMFVGFYVAAVACAGLVGGAVNLANISGAVNMASKFGADTGSLSNALKLARLTNIEGLFSNVLETGVTDMPSGDWGLDELSDWNFDIDLGFDPSIGEGLFDGVDFSDAFSALDDSNLNIDILWDANLGDQWGDFGTFTADAGPLTGAQFATVAKAAPAVMQAAGAAMQRAGAPVTGTAATPQQIQQARNFAAEQAQAAGNPAQSSMWAQATQLLGMYTQYQLQSQQVQRGIPLGRTYPTAAQPIVRQPDGSISMLQADGTIRTLAPNGAMQSGLGSQLAALFTPRNLIIGGGIAAAAFVASRMSRR